MEEVWKDIPGLSGCYQASNLGRIKSVGRIIYSKPSWQSKNGCFSTLRSRILSLTDNGRGYLNFHTSIERKAKNMSVHRAVATAFIPNPDNHRVVNHINGVKLDNCVSNLEWCTYGDNNRHAFKMGLHPLGKDRTSAVRVINTKDLIVFGCIRKTAKFYGLNYRSLVVSLNNPVRKRSLLEFRHLRKMDEFIEGNCKDAQELKEYLKTNSIHYL